MIMLLLCYVAGNGKRIPELMAKLLLLLRPPYLLSVIPIPTCSFSFKKPSHSQFSCVRCCISDENKKKKLSEQSSWETKDSEGKDYLYRLGAEADNMNIAVGQRAGIIDDVFAGNFLGRDSDIVFDYRQKVTRSFQYLQGDYYIAPLFMDKVVTHITKNYLSHLLNAKVPLILGIWGGKGQGKTFQTELIFRAMGVEPVIMSAGELESENAGEPGRLIRERYRTASKVVQNQVTISFLPFQYVQIRDYLYISAIHPNKFNIMIYLVDFASSYVVCTK